MEARLQTGPFGTHLKASEYRGEGTPVINVRNIGFGGLRWLPRAYTPDLFVQKVSVLFEHVYESYQGEGRSVYNRVA